MQLQTQPKRVVLKQRPPTFDGLSENSRLWLKEYCTAANLNNWTNFEKAQYLSTVFIGPAKIWFDGQFDGEIPDWEEFEKRFTDTYQPVGYNQRKLCEFYSRKQTDDETPIEYLDQMVRLRNEIEPKPSEKDVIGCVKRGIAKVYAGSVVNIDDLIELRSTLNKMIEYLEEPEKPKKTLQRQLATSNQRPAQPVQEIKHTMRPTVSVRPSNEFKITCYNCDKVGHRSRECPEPYNQSKVTQHFANLNYARNPLPHNSYQRSNWRPPLHMSQQNQRDALNGVYNWYRDQPTEAEQPSQPGQPPHVVQQNRFQQLRQTSSENKDKWSNGPCSSPLPTMDLVISGAKDEGLLDTGGAFSLISIDLVIELKLVIEEIDVQIQGLGERPVDVLGKIVSVPVLFDGYVMTMPFVVVADLFPEVILGIDFIRAANLVIYPNSQIKQYHVMSSSFGKSPCSDTEDVVIRGGRPQYNLRHATDKEQEYMNKVIPSKIKVYSEEERKLYLNKNIKRQTGTEKVIVCPPTLLAPTQPKELLQTYYSFNIKTVKRVKENDVKLYVNQKSVKQSPKKEETAKLSKSKEEATNIAESSQHKKKNQVNQSGKDIKFKKSCRVTHRLTKSKGSYKSSIGRAKRPKLNQRRDKDSKVVVVSHDIESHQLLEPEQPTQPLYRPKTETRKPKTLKDFVIYLYGLIN